MKDKHKAIIAIVGVYGGIALLFVVFTIILILFGFRACALNRTYSHDYLTLENGTMSFGVSDEKKDTFAGGARWDGGDMSFRVPDEFGGYKVTKLGGIYGTREQIFEVRINDELLDKEYNVETGQERFDKHHRDDDEYETFTFTIYIGKNIKKFHYVDPSYYLANWELTDDGEKIYDFVYKIECYFVVDEENETFYSKDGKVYYKVNNELLECFD